MGTSRTLCLLIFALAVVLCGCAEKSSDETLISDIETRRTEERRPDWTYIPPPSSQGKVFFVGRSLAVNVLDEKNAMNQAMDDAIHQIARAAGAEYIGSSESIDRRSGEAIRGNERTEQISENQFRVELSGTVIGIRQEDVFWERYSVQEEASSSEYRRYIYYVLVSVPEQELKELEEQIKKKSQLD